MGIAYESSVYIKDLQILDKLSDYKLNKKDCTYGVSYSRWRSHCSYEGVSKSFRTESITK